MERENVQRTRATRHATLPPPRGEKFYKASKKQKIDIKELTPETEDKRESTMVT